MYTRYRTGVLLLLLALTAGCSQVKFAYNQADIGIRWYVGSLVTLNDEQKQMMNASLDQLLAWHCQHELPIYATSLAQIARSAEDGAISVATIDYWGEEVEAAWARMGAQLAEPAVDILVTLDDDQIDELEQNLQAQINETRTEYASRDYSPDKRIKRVAKNFERWMGRLTDEQLRLITDWEKQSRPLLSSWIDSRVDWTDQFIAALREEQADRTLLRRLLLHPDEFRSAENLAAGDQWRADFSTMMDALYQQSTSKQRSRSASRLRDWQADFEELSCLAPEGDGSQTIAMIRPIAH